MKDILNRHVRKGMALLAVSFVSVSLLLPSMAFAYGGGGGGGGGGADNDPADNRVFDDTPPDLPDLGQFFDPYSVINTDPVLPDQPVVLTDLDYDWSNFDDDWNDFWNDNGEGIMYTADLTGTVVTMFIPGYGWFKVGHMGMKALAFARDKQKQEFAKKVLASLANYQTPAGGIGTGNTATK